MKERSFWMTLFCLVAILAGCSLAQESNPLAAVESLRQPVTIRQKMILLPDLLREIGKQTKVSLSCGRELSSDRLTVFVKEKPAVEVLDHIATLMMGEWRKTGNGYVLRQSAEAQKAEEELIALELQQARSRAEQKAREWMSIAEKDYSQWMRATEQARRTLFKDGGPRIATPEGEVLSISPESLPGLYPEAVPPPLPNYLAGWLLRQFQPAHWRSLWEGRVFIASTLDLPSAWRLPPEAVAWAREDIVPEQVSGGAQPDGNNVTGLQDLRRQKATTSDVVLIVKFDAVTGVSAQLLRLTGGQAVLPERSTSFLPDRRRFDHPLLERWDRWQTPDSDRAKHPVLKAALKHMPPLSRTSDSILWRMYRLGGVRLADLIEQMVRASEGKVQVIADTYRCSWECRAGRFGKGTDPATCRSLEEWLKAVFDVSEPAHQGGWWRIEGDCLLMKHNAFWLLRRTELAEWKVREMERKVALTQPVQLDDYAELASPMGLLHEIRAEVRPYAFTFDPEPLRHYHLLRFLGALSPAQRENLRRMQALPLATLSPLQQSALWEGAWHSVVGVPSVKGARLELVAPEASPVLTLDHSTKHVYALSSHDVHFVDADIGSVRQMAEQMFAKGQVDTGYRVHPCRADEYDLQVPVMPSLKWIGRLTVLTPIPESKEYR